MWHLFYSLFNRDKWSIGALNLEHVFTFYPARELVSIHVYVACEFEKVVPDRRRTVWKKKKQKSIDNKLIILYRTFTVTTIIFYYYNYYDYYDVFVRQLQRSFITITIIGFLYLFFRPPFIISHVHVQPTRSITTETSRPTMRARGVFAKTQNDT